MRRRLSSPARRAEAARSYSVCDAPGCGERIARGKLMCRAHWFQLPRPLRGAIVAAWAARQFEAWRANRREARSYLANNTPAALAARITGDRT